MKNIAKVIFYCSNLFQIRSNIPNNELFCSLIKKCIVYFALIPCDYCNFYNLSINDQFFIFFIFKDGDRDTDRNAYFSREICSNLDCFV